MTRPAQFRPDLGGENPHVSGVSVERLLRLPVRVRGIQVGKPIDLILDRERSRALGLEILCGDDERRFLPFAVVRGLEEAIEVRSPLVLLEEAELAFYTDRGSTFASLRGRPVSDSGGEAGRLVDLELGPDGAIRSVLVETAEGQRALAFGPRVVLGGGGRNVRAAS